MKYVMIICEGDSEVEFVNQLLKPYFKSSLLLTPINIGGGLTFEKIVEFSIKICRSNPHYTTTIADFCDISPKFINKSEYPQSNLDRVKHIETQIKEKVISFLEDYSLGNRFFPFLSLQQFETMLLANKSILGNYTKNTEVFGVFA